VNSSNNRSSSACGCNSSLARRDFLKLAGLAAAGATLPRLSVNAEPIDAAALARMTEVMAKQETLFKDSLFLRGQRRVYADNNLGAISLPLGGIAAGPIQINGQGRRHIWQIARNYKAISLPHTFFAVRSKAANGPAVMRAMQTEIEGPFEAMKSLKFSGEYPFGWYAFEDSALPATISMECFSPLIPLNEKDSSIPCAIFKLTAENKGQTPVEISFLATQQNAVGMDAAQAISGRSSPAYGGNVNRVLRDRGATLLHLSTTKPKGSPVYGDMTLAALVKEVSATAAWENLETLAAKFAERGDVEESETAGPTPVGQTADGALAVPFVLAPGEKRTVSFVLAWHFPNVPAPRHSPSSGIREPSSFPTVSTRLGNKYDNWWPDALTVARDVIARFGELSAKTHLYNETFYESNLPYWLLDRISSQVAILSSMTCSWTRDGFFYAWEGCGAGGGCCAGNATHVWDYAQSHARLFPAVGRSMRDADAGNVQPEGMLPVRFAAQHPAFDGQCAFVMSSYREHLLSADGKWLNSRWPTVKRVMDYTIARWDAPTPSHIEGKLGGLPDGMLTGPQHAMDGDQGGTCSWLGSIYLGALAAAAKMADFEGDSASAARYRQILAAGSKNQDKALFNGEYYIQVPDLEPRQDYVTGCYIDQLLGQWWALQIDCGWLYPPEHVRSAMSAMFKYNFHANLKDLKQSPRRFCEDTDAGMQQGTWPKGGKPRAPHVILYTDEIMSGFEYSAAGLMIYAGLMPEAFTVIRAAADRYDGRLRSNLTKGDTASWGYSGNPFGDDECGKFYARAMAIWSTLLACQGFSYDGPARLIGFRPVWKPEDHKSFFTAAEGWGLFTQHRINAEQMERIEVRHGKLALKSMDFAVAPGMTPSEVIVRVGDKTVKSGFVVKEGTIKITLASGVTVGEGQAVDVHIK
jgi:non-lysosomal glucosylceramidase